MAVLENELTAARTALGRYTRALSARSEADVVAELQRAAAEGPLRGVMHSFCGDLATAKACLELGLYISLAGCRFNKL
jgi:Tat protein secretion system quality control protein TatD with DNase activity